MVLYGQNFGGTEPVGGCLEILGMRERCVMMTQQVYGFAQLVSLEYCQVSLTRNKLNEAPRNRAIAYRWLRNLVPNSQWKRNHSQDPRRQEDL